MPPGQIIAASCIDAIAARVTLLIGASSGAVTRFDGSLIHPAATYGWTNEEIELVRKNFRDRPAAKLRRRARF
jgi:hypothetical protein